MENPKIKENDLEEKSEGSSSLNTEAFIEVGKRMINKYGNMDKKSFSEKLLEVVNVGRLKQGYLILDKLKISDTDMNKIYEKSSGEPDINERLKILEDRLNKKRFSFLKPLFKFKTKIGYVLWGIVTFLLLFNLLYCFLRFKDLENKFNNKVFELKTEANYLSTIPKTKLPNFDTWSKKEIYKGKIEKFENVINNMSVEDIYFKSFDY